MDYLTAGFPRVMPMDLLGWDRMELLSLALLVLAFAGVLCLFSRRK